MRAGGGSEGGIGDGGGGIHGSREITTPRSELAGRTKTSPNQGGALVGEGDEKMNRVRWDGGAGEGNCGGREKATRGYSAGVGDEREVAESMRVEKNGITGDSVPEIGRAHV